MKARNGAIPAPPANITIGAAESSGSRKRGARTTRTGISSASPAPSTRRRTNDEPVPERASSRDTALRSVRYSSPATSSSARDAQGASSPCAEAME
jgi:hypothetical protein